MRELKDWQIKAALCLVLLITFAIFHASLLWGFSKITALESQLIAQHEADYVTCDLCGREFARDEEMVVGTGLVWSWRLGQAQADTLYAGSYEWAEPYYHLCPGCAKALRAQLGGTE